MRDVARSRCKNRAVRCVKLMVEAAQAVCIAFVWCACRGPSGSAPDSLAPVAAASVTSAVPSAPAAAIAVVHAAAPPGSVSEVAPPPPMPATDAGVANGADVEESLLDAQGKPLPQTQDKPSTTSETFRRRIAAVAAAIISDDATPALSSFFPLVAYAQVKDVAKPERDYKFRLLANFTRDVHEYHRALGRDAAGAEFSGVTVSETQAKWMEPGSEGNKLGYFRVLRSHLQFTLPTGRKRELELTSLISWRGEWYVVHLHGFE